MNPSRKRPMGGDAMAPPPLPPLLHAHADSGAGAEYDYGYGDNSYGKIAIIPLASLFKILPFIFRFCIFLFILNLILFQSQ